MSFYHYLVTCCLIRPFFKKKKYFIYLGGGEAVQGGLSCPPPRYWRIQYCFIHIWVQDISHSKNRGFKSTFILYQGGSNDGEEKKINIKNLGGGRDKLPWTGCPPPMYQLFTFFPTLKKSL